MKPNIWPNTWPMTTTPHIWPVNGRHRGSHAHPERRDTSLSVCTGRHCVGQHAVLAHRFTYPDHHPARGAR